jgi:hypothetical protein
MNIETNPAEEPEVEELEEEQLEEGSTEADESENPEEETDEPDEETTEVERDGKTYKVPAALKDDFLRQADYTRKTQEIAAERKELASLRERVQQAGEAEVNARARSVAIDAAVKQYEGVNWDQLQAQDPGAAFQHWRKYQELIQAKGEADNEYAQAVEQRTLETQREAEKRIEQGIAELQRDIPDWGPEKAEQLLTFGEKQFGFSRDYMQGVEDPNLIKVMNFAFLAAKQTQPKQAAQPAPTVKPAAKVKGGTTPRKGLDDRMNAEDWIAERNRQVAARRR